MFLRSSTFPLTDLSRRLFFILATCSVAAVLLYMYGISASIMNVVLREEAERNIAETHSRVAMLEARYLEMKEAIDMNRAMESGFVVITEKEFVTRPGLSYVAR